MNLKNIIKDIIFMPMKFNNINNSQSVYSLLKNTLYFNVYDQITETHISQELKNHLDSIGDWISWSENKRSINSWYFEKKSNDKYVIGYIGINGQQNEYFEFDDAIIACSMFIKKEIESIRNS